MSTAFSRRRFLQATGVGLSLPILSQLLVGCQAIGPASGGSAGSAAMTEIVWSRGDDLRTQDPQLIAGRMEGEINRCI